MHILLNSLIGFSIKALDGEIGKVYDFYFDDDTWTIRYLVVRTGGWLSGRLVLIPVSELGNPEWEREQFIVNLTCEQVRNSPDIDTDLPVYRQQEIRLYEHYHWLPYWQMGIDGTSFLSSPITELTLKESAEQDEAESTGDTHLRSMRHIIGYYIHATNGSIGHVAECIVDNANWILQSFVADTRNFFPGKKVILPISRVLSIDWLGYNLQIDLTKDEVRNSPEFKTSELELAIPSTYWIGLPSNIRHNQTCKYYHTTKAGYFTNKKEGAPCKICGG